MARKTNKTSHVLNLITNGPAAPEDETEAKVAEPKESEDKTAESKAAKHETSEEKAPESKSEEHKTSGEKMSESKAAEHETSGEKTPETKSAPKEEILAAVPEKEKSVVRVSSGEKRVIVVDESSENQKIETQILDQLTTHLEEEEKAEKKEKEEFHIINVMEEVLALKHLEKYMKDYGVCTCNRCQADVRALTLTGLPAKYMVVHGESVSPLIGYYENKFKAKVLAEIIKACIQVREHPRH
ncbi:MAG: late competence development ComFB family protein [Lachnospiraceae bacterium]